MDRARREPPGFRIDRPHGGGDYVIIHLLTPTRMLTRDGMCLANAGDCMIYAPDDAQWFEAATRGGVFVNDFIHAEGAAVIEALDSFELPIGRLFRSLDAEAMGTRIEAMMLEAARREPYWEQALALRYRELCLGLSRGIVAPGADARSPRQGVLLERFRRLRTTMLAQLHQTWNVTTMAETVHLSRTRFTVLYHQFFGVAPGEDLIRERLRHARWLLARGNHTVSEVAEQCGFNNACHFSRLFHQRVGCPPRDYGRERP